jgi:hypothetical protein
MMVEKFYTIAYPGFSRIVLNFATIQRRYDDECSEINENGEKISFVLYENVIKF